MKKPQGMSRPTPGDYHSRYQHFKHQGRPFWPDIILEDVLVALVVFLGLLVLTVLWEVPLEPRADPTNAAYVPSPEWYFMFLFQLLKLFPGYLEWVAVIAVPAIGVMLLLLLPFYDRHVRRHPRFRPVAMASGLAALGGIVALTFLAFASMPPSTTEAVSAQRLTPAQLAGRQLYESNCAPCHSLGGKGGNSAPPLDGIALRMDPAFLHLYIEDPQTVNPNSTMPPFVRFPDIKKLSHQETEYIVQYLQAVAGKAGE